MSQIDASRFCTVSRLTVTCSTPSVQSIETISAAIRDVADFPKKGIVFKDITPVLADPKLFKSVLSHMENAIKDLNVEKIVGIDARGFIFGAALADRLNIGFVPVRKKGKLPWKTHEQSYSLEYGESIVQIHEDAVHAGEKVAIIDDLLATGGTAAAAVTLLKKLDADIVNIVFLIELAFLNGREGLGQTPITSLISY